MTASSRVEPAHAIENLRAGLEHEGAYVTDGIRLYRSLGKIDSVGPGTAAMEDCHSLEVILVRLDEVRNVRLRCVIPAEGPPAGETAGLG
jgi:hypothetical protein